MKTITPDEFGFGKTKIFVKSPETIFTIEELLEQKVNPEGTTIHTTTECCVSLVTLVFDYKICVSLD